MNLMFSRAGRVHKALLHYDIYTIIIASCIGHIVGIKSYPLQCNAEIGFLDIARQVPRQVS
jgi:hypothetical protein